MINQMFNPKPLQDLALEKILRLEAELKEVREAENRRQDGKARIHEKYRALQKQVQQLKVEARDADCCWAVNRKLGETLGEFQKDNIELQKELRVFQTWGERSKVKLNTCQEANRELKESRDKLQLVNVKLHKELGTLKEQDKAVKIVRTNEIQALLRIANDEAVYHEKLKKATEELDESFVRACLDLRSFQEAADIEALDKSFLRICNVAKSLRESNKKTVADLQFLVNDDHRQHPQVDCHSDAMALEAIRNRVAMNQEDSESLSIYTQRVIGNLQRIVNKKTVAVTNLEGINTELYESITKQAETINNLRELERQYSRTIADLQKTIGRYQVTNTDLRENARNLQRIGDQRSEVIKNLRATVVDLQATDTDLRNNSRVLSNRLKQSEADRKLAEDNVKAERKTVADLLIQLKGSEDNLRNLRRIILDTS